MRPQKTPNSPKNLERKKKNKARSITLPDFSVIKYILQRN